MLQIPPTCHHPKKLALRKHRIHPPVKARLIKARLIRKAGLVVEALQRQQLRKLALGRLRKVLQAVLVVGVVGNRLNRQIPGVY
jgi:hypothetical protein